MLQVAHSLRFPLRLAGLRQAWDAPHSVERGRKDCLAGRPSSWHQRQPGVRCHVARHAGARSPHSSRDGFSTLDPAPRPSTTSSPASVSSKPTPPSNSKSLADTTCPLTPPRRPSTSPPPAPPAPVSSPSGPATNHNQMPATSTMQPARPSPTLSSPRSAPPATYASTLQPAPTSLPTSPATTQPEAPSPHSFRDGFSTLDPAPRPSTTSSPAFLCPASQHHPQTQNHWPTQRAR